FDGARRVRLGQGVLDASEELNGPETPAPASAASPRGWSASPEPAARRNALHLLMFAMLRAADGAAGDRGGGTTISELPLPAEGSKRPAKRPPMRASTIEGAAAKPSARARTRPADLARPLLSAQRDP